MTTIIGLNGVAQSGKDSAALYLVSCLDFRQRAFADKLRAVLYGTDPYVPLVGLGSLVIPDGWARLRDLVDRMGWDEAKTTYPEVRRLLQLLGTEGVRDNLGWQTWINAAFADIDEARGISPLDDGTDESRWVFTDARFPNEIDAIHERGGQVWRITRPGVGAVNAHQSEQTIPDDQIDLEIVNDGALTDLGSRVLDAAGRLI